MSVKVISIFEDRQAKLQITNEEINELLSYKKLFGPNNFLLQADGTILVRHYIGYVSGRNVALQVLPKVYYEDQPITYDLEKDEAVLVFFRLLKWSGFSGIKELPNTQAVSCLNGDLLEIFIALFVSRFIELFVHNPHRQYVEYDENMQFIRGKIDFPNTILRCGYRKHLHHVRYDELTMNNLLNRVFKTVMMRLSDRTTSEDNHKKLFIALSYLEEIETVRISSTVFNSIRFNRLNEEYHPLFNMVKMFYHNLQPGYRQGDEDVFTFLVPLNRLFEYYVYKLINAIYMDLKNELYSVKYHEPVEYLAKCSNRQEIMIIPDITILNESANRNSVKLIIDAKYKNPSSILNSDIYQMISYAAHYNCNLLMLAYPSFKNNMELVKNPVVYNITDSTEKTSPYIPVIT